MNSKFPKAPVKITFHLSRNFHRRAHIQIYTRTNIRVYVLYTDRSIYVITGTSGGNRRSRVTVHGAVYRGARTREITRMNDCLNSCQIVCISYDK